MGRRAALEVIKGGKIKSVINALGVLGLFMMGIMAAKYVTLSTPIAFTMSGKEFILQETLDGILPGILPLCAVPRPVLLLPEEGHEGYAGHARLHRDPRGSRCARHPVVGIRKFES